MSWTCCAVIAPASTPCSAIAWSSSERPSRTEPSAARTSSASAPGSTATRSLSATFARWRRSTSPSMRRRSKRWQRDSTVTGTLRTSVVANTKIVCGGGSSSVLSRPLKAFSDSMWTSSTM